MVVMGVVIGGAPSRFSDRVLKLLERIEHRVARSPAEREAVFRLRYDSYLRNGLVRPRADGRMHDPNYDDAPNAWMTTTFVDGELAGTTRVNLGQGEQAILPSLQVYPDVIAARLRAGQVIVEFTRLAAQLSLAEKYSELAYCIMRPAYMAADHFDADVAIATPRADHVAFYRRVFQGEVLCSPRDYPGLTVKLACMSANYRLVRQDIEARYPFYKSTLAEREALFGPRPSALDSRVERVRPGGEFPARLGMALARSR
jgi:hypothetical protein